MHQQVQPMGITIHYSGKLDDVKALPGLLREVKGFCRQRVWPCREVDARIVGVAERFKTVSEKKKRTREGGEFSDCIVQTEEVKVADRERGVLISPHPESETLALVFNRDGELCHYFPSPKPRRYLEMKSLFCKTQFAPIETHIAICELLHVVQDRHFPGLKVTDEGEYWQTGDREVLARNLGIISSMMEKIEAALTNPDDRSRIGKTIRRAVEDAAAAQGKPRPSKKKGLKVVRGKEIVIREPGWKRKYRHETDEN